MDFFQYFSECSCAIPRDELVVLQKEEKETHENMQISLFANSQEELGEADAEIFEIATPEVISTTAPSSEYDEYDDYFSLPESLSRDRRDTTGNYGQMLSGACLQGCAFGFYAFTAVSAIINIFGASGRIGNLLVNYR